MLAMLGALISMPMTSTYAFAMAGAKSAATASMDGMPCHKPVKHCPDCPQKVCPDIGTCLVKCFQPLSPPVAEARLQGDVVSERVVPEPSQVTGQFPYPSTSSTSQRLNRAHSGVKRSCG